MLRKAVWILCASLALAGISADASIRDWTMLGKKNVGGRLDRDEIRVGLSEGGFTKMRIAVHGRGVEFHKVVVYFGSGQPYELEVRQYIPAGAQSRIIDLPGRSRLIRKVVFWYETRSGGREATVTLWGKRD